MQKKIIFAAHDPGGYNLLEPLIEEILKQGIFNVDLLLIGPAYTRAKQNELLLPFLKKIITFPIVGFENEIDVEFEYFNEIFNQLSPDIVFVATSINSNIERYSIHLAKTNKKLSFVYIDSWAGHNIRFASNRIKVIPDNIIVCDDFMAQLYHEYKKVGSIVYIAGNLHLESLYELRSSFSYNDQSDTLSLLFVTENIAHYYPEALVNEFTIVREILMSYNISRKLLLRIRPHPLESRDKWRNFIDETAGTNDHIRVVLDESPSIAAALSTSSFTIGISTMALIESSILGIPTFSYQKNISDSSMLYIPYGLYNIGVIKQTEEFNEIVRNIEIIQNNNLQFKFPFVGARKKILSLLNISCE